ncbi:MAG: hypothetical protein JNK48_13685, partial [Bryobacterales bacterium]|nr:hypothetical protein [Bryobacterales bacterium]
MIGLRNQWRLLPMLALMAGMEVYGSPVHYTFHFETEAVGLPIPTGGFTYDGATGMFSNFVVV